MRRGPFRVGEVAEFLGVHRNTVILWISSGALPAFRTEGGHYRVHASDIDVFIARRQTAVQPAA